jgi:hypothetical protein
MLKSLLRYAQLKEYLSILAEGDLPQRHKAIETSKIIEKGVKFLKLLHEMDQRLQPSRSIYQAQSWRQELVYLIRYQILLHIMTRWDDGVYREQKVDYSRCDSQIE